MLLMQGGKIKFENFNLKELNGSYRSCFAAKYLGLKWLKKK